MPIKAAKLKPHAEFDSQYSVLNPAQKKAVDTIEGPVMVIAGPGTGKTTILTLRIANIIRTTDTAPESILALTFTESGAFAMRRKLAGIIGSAGYRVNVHTFHGFAEHIIQQYPDYFPRIIGSTIITDAEQIRIIEKCVKSPKIKVLRPYGDPSYYVKSVLNEIHLLKRENVSPKQLLKSINSDMSFSLQTFPLRASQSRKVYARSGRVGQDLSKTEREKIEKRDAKNRELVFVYAAYEAELEKQKYYDFDDMLLELIRVMEEDPMFKLMLQETHQYILADEHQDANASQNRILELLADFHASPNLFIVGDDKQAIYRFQGASLENFLYFTKKYPDAAVIDLEHNYRSHQGILDAAHSLMSNNPPIPGRERRKLMSLQVGGKPIYVDEFKTIEEEIEYVAVLVEQLIEKGEKPEEIAMLYRENKEAAALSHALRAHGISHRIESEHDILGEPDVATIIMLCRAIHDPSNSEYLGQALLLPELGNDSGEVMDAFACSRKEGLPLYKALRASPQTAYERIKRWSGEAQTMPFPNFLQKLIQETGLIASVMGAENSLERLSALESFYDRVRKAAQAKRSFYLKDFIEYIAIVSEHGLNAKRAESEHVKGVRLMTAHRAKGLEFNHVFIIHAVDGSWGNRITRSHFTVPVVEQAHDAGRIDDERRLFYVAMTRARESVNVSFARSNGERETIPSQFIAEIDPTLVIFGRPKAIDRGAFFMRRMAEPSKAAVNPILDGDFVCSKFLGQPFSVTHLNNYLKCPWEYFFVNLIRVPQAPTKHQMYGTAIHAALRTFFDAYRDGRDLSRKKLIEIFRHHIDKQPMSVADRRESFERGKRALAGYYDQYAGNDSWGRRLITEYSVKGADIEIDVANSRIKERLELTGKLDKVEFMDDAHVLVVDFKTAKPKSRNDIEGKTKSSRQNGGGNYKRQLVFYKMLLDGSQKFTMRYGEIDFIEPNERGIYKKERFEATDAEVGQLKKEIARVASEIIGLGFMDTTCGDKECPFCRLGKMLRRD